MSHFGMKTEGGIVHIRQQSRQFPAHASKQTLVGVISMSAGNARGIAPIISQWPGYVVYFGDPRTLEP